MASAATFHVIDGDLTIDSATAQDYQRVGDLTVDAYLHAGYFQDPQHDYLQFVRRVAERGAHAQVLVARRAGTVIASMTLVQHGNRYADIATQGELELRMLAVDPAVQRSGAGRAMVRAAIIRARQLPGVHSLSLTTGADWAGARALYESMGFVRRAERDWYVPGTEILLLVYTLELS